MDLADIIVEALEKAKQQIQDNMAAKNINASGRTSRSFRVERYDRGVRLVMGGTGEPTAPLEPLELGRPAGPIPANMTDILVQWSKDKGIPFGSNDGDITELGNGNINFKEVIRVAEAIGVQDYCYEQDRNFVVNSLESAKQSAEYFFSII